MHAWAVYVYDSESCILIELTPKITSDAFYNGELESEVRTLLEESKLILDDCVFQKDSDRESIMQMVESIRSHSIYPHLKCTTECKERGTAILLDCVYIKIW